MNFVYLFFMGAAWVVIQCLIGGTRLLFSLPAYGLLAAGAVLTLASFRARRIPPNAACMISTLILGAWVLARASRSPVQYLALPDFYMMMACLMAYLMTAYYIVSLKDRTILIGVLWAIAGLEVFCGLVQFVKDNGFMLFGFIRGGNVGRASGMFISANHFAGFLEAIAILSLSMAVWSRWPAWGKALAVYITFSCWLGVAISGSRGGYFSTVATLAAFSGATIYTIRQVDPRRFWVTVAGAVTAVVMMVGLAALLMANSRLLSHRMETMVVKDVRIYNWAAAIDHFRVSPWIGTGAGTHLIYGRLFRRVQIQADPVHAHCDYLELLAEYGIAGGACMLLFLGAHLWNGVRAFSEIMEKRLMFSGFNRSNGFAMNLGALCAVVGLAVHSVVDFNMHIPGNALLFAFIFGMLGNPGIDPAPGSVVGRVLPWGRLLLPALGVWMICAGLPLLPSEWCAERARAGLRDHQYLETINYAKLATGRFQGRVPSSEGDLQIFGKPWESYMGGIDGMVRTFGGNPRNPDLYFYEGEANRALGSRMPIFLLKRRYYQAAIAAFSAGLKIFPQDENAMVRMAQCYDGLKQYQAAEDLYQRCFEADPHLETLYAYYASHLMAEGNKAGADAATKTEEALDRGEVDTEQKADSVLR